MKKKIVALLCCVLVLTPFINGCTNPSNQSSSDKTSAIKIWHYYNGKQKEAFDTLVNKFNETVGLEKNIVVTAHSKGNVDDLANAIMDSAEKKVGSDELPNLFATYSDVAYTLQKSDMLADLSLYFTEQELGEYLSDFLEEGYFGSDGLWVFPVAKSTEQLYLNLTDWNEFAAATGHTTDELSTWEGLAQVAEEYYQWSDGKSFFGRDAMPNYLIIGSKQLGSTGSNPLGYEIFQVDKNGNCQVNLEENVMKRLWDNYAAPYLKGHFNAYGKFRSDDVKTGHLIACVGSISSTSFFPDQVTRNDGSTYEIETVVLPLPNFSDTNSYAVQQGAGMALLKSNEQQEQAAIEFLKWFTDEKQNASFCVESGYMPVKLSALQQDTIEKALKDSTIPEDSLSAQSLQLAIKSTAHTQLYTTKPFEGGYDARGVLNTYMTTVLDNYRTEFKNAMAEHPDQDPEELMDQYFIKWLDGLREALNWKA